MSPSRPQWAHSGYSLDIAGFDVVEAFLLTREETGHTGQNEGGYENPVSSHRATEPSGDRGRSGWDKFDCKHIITQQGD